ncbi:hypothetical protein MJO28_004735 [Puccinia striiformis f. sp. tritici]|uniref:Uncharacterized protein n=1 Tax=Puccinia striiformis f. sp. tritici TaxID=168172 RepID=A0ACC0EIU1_9BASI|nr:hypothetical protein MJO28_004735 [Puccinia striiformis f. sp. tritici]KAI7959764.1 hypothetical protein MJO29_004832 [Puccinia striiformis f. sp. tritici]
MNPVPERPTTVPPAALKLVSTILGRSEQSLNKLPSPLPVYLAYSAELTTAVTSSNAIQIGASSLERTFTSDRPRFD